MKKGVKIAMVVILAFVAVSIIGTFVVVGAIGNGVNEVVKEYEDKHQIEVSGEIIYTDEAVTYMIGTYPSVKMAGAGNTFVFVTYTVKNVGTDNIDISYLCLKPAYNGVTYERT